MGLTVKSTAELVPEYLFYFLLGFDLSSISNSAGIALINNGDIASVEIPLPPLATQQAIVAEIEAEQALVAANCELITRFEKKIQATLARVWGEDVPVAEVAKTANPTIVEPSKPEMPQSPRQIKTLASAK